MNKNQEAINYWLKSAIRDEQTAKILFENKRHVHCLFFCHLAIEKILKALIVKKTKDNPLPIHNLNRLAKDLDIKLSQKQKGLLQEINEFNIQARYNDFKFRFYQKATSGFTLKYFEESKKLFRWLKKQL